MTKEQKDKILKMLAEERNEVAQALNELVDNLERIEKKYAEPQESEDEYDKRRKDKRLV